MDHVQHFEIPYKVRERAKKFYFQAFGWQVFDVPGTSYSFVTTVPIDGGGMPKRPGAINGGLTPRTKELTAPTLLIKVDDLPPHLTRIQHAGGSILVQPTAMGPVWYARFRDPEGNVMGVIQDRPEGQETAKAVVKTASRSKAVVRRASRAKAAKASAKAGKTRAPARKAPKRKAKPAKVSTTGLKPQRKSTAKPRKAKAPLEPKATWSR